MKKQDRYLPMRESEFVALLSMVNEINKQIMKMKKIARKERQHLDDENDNFTQVPLSPMQKKRPDKCAAPSSDSNDSSSCEEAVEGPSMGKGGGKKPKLAKKKKAKEWRKKMI